MRTGRVGLTGMFLPLDGAQMLRFRQSSSWRVKASFEMA